MKIKIGLFISSISLLISLGCTATIKQTSGTFISGTSAGDAETLNYILAADSASFSYVGHTLDSLVTYDNDWKVQLRCAAKDVEISSDGLVYMVTIRDDLMWSNGSKVTATDYVYTLKNLMFSDWLNYPYKSDWQETIDGKKVMVNPQVVSDTVFSITRKTVDPEFIFNVRGLTPYPKDIAEKYEGKIDDFTQAPEFNNLTYTGNLGPYKFVEWVRNDKFVVERNPNYYLGKEDKSPYFEKYIVKLFGTPPTRHAALEAGDITYSGIDPPQVAKFQRLQRIQVYTVPTTGYLFMAYNMRNNGWEGLKDEKVRQAFSMAINKETVIQQVLLGFGQPAFSFIPNTSPWYVDRSLTKYGISSLYNPEKAAQLLYEVGYGEKGPEGKFKATTRDKKQLKLTLITNSGNEERENTSFLIKQELLALGIEVEVKPVPWATMLRKYLMNKTPGTSQEPRYNSGKDAVSEEPWDLMVIGFSTNPLSPSGSDVIYTQEGGLNFFGYFNPKVDELFRKAKSKEALDESYRRQVYSDISQIISEDQPADFLAFQLANVGFQRNLKGIEPGINMGYNYHQWFFE